MTAHPLPAADGSPAVQALGLLLLGGCIRVDSLQPAEFSSRISRGASELRRRGWPVWRHARRWMLSPTARSDALRAGGADWAARAVADPVIDRERERIGPVGADDDAR